MRSKTTTCFRYQPSDLGSDKGTIRRKETFVVMGIHGKCCPKLFQVGNASSLSSLLTGLEEDRKNYPYQQGYNGYHH